MTKMIDTKHNTVLTKAYEQIQAMAKAVDSHDLAKLYGVACGYIESLRDSKILPQSGFENMMGQSLDAHNEIAKRNGWLGKSELK
ncbi:hypothetical protein [Pseudomonas sp. BF-R-01]|uniref:hypothetical protein n=1 Tax=Pseudomonas sp. BF-R-01 TaxID=2832365 RepID=UPI001CC1553B|nr:hypothetical protein [Pseudomonas sp. BF-R-01]